MAAPVFAKLNIIQVSNSHSLKTREEMFSTATCSLTTGLESDKSKNTDIYTRFMAGEGMQSLPSMFFNDFKGQVFTFSLNSYNIDKQQRHIKYPICLPPVTYQMLLGSHYLYVRMPVSQPDVQLFSSEISLRARCT